MLGVRCEVLGNPVIQKCYKGHLDWSKITNILIGPKITMGYIYHEWVRYLPTRFFAIPVEFELQGKP